MVGGNTCVADPLAGYCAPWTTNVVYGNHVYKSVWSPVTEQLILEKEPANPYDELIVAMIKDSQVVGYILKNYSQIMWFLLHEGALSSVQYSFSLGTSEEGYYWE